MQSERFRVPPPVLLLLLDVQTTWCRCSVSYTGYQPRQRVVFKFASLVRWSMVPSRRLPSCRRCSSATTTFHSEPNVHCEWWRGYKAPSAIEHLQLLDWTMEQSSITPERDGLIVQYNLAVAKNIFVRIVEPRRIDALRPLDDVMSSPIRLWARRSFPPPRGNFLHYFFLKPQCLLSIFYLFCNLATGAFVSYRGQRSSSAVLNVIYQLISN